MPETICHFKLEVGTIHEAIAKVDEYIHMQYTITRRGGYARGFNCLTAFAGKLVIMGLLTVFEVEVL